MRKSDKELVIQKSIYFSFALIDSGFISAVRPSHIPSTLEQFEKEMLLVFWLSSGIYRTKLIGHSILGKEKGKETSLSANIPKESFSLLIMQCKLTSFLRAKYLCFGRISQRTNLR